MLIGFELTQGKFTETEDAALELAIEDYKSTHQLSDSALSALITTSRTSTQGKTLKLKHPDFWQELGKSLKSRSLISIYNHTKRIFDPRSNAGKWTSEENKELEMAIRQYGISSWVEVGDRVGRTGADCRDRWRILGPVVEEREARKKKEQKEKKDNEKKDKGKAKSKGKEKEVEHKSLNNGSWTEEEKKLLEKLVNKYGHSWNTIGKLMKTRTSVQCRTHWLVYISFYSFFVPSNLIFSLFLGLIEPKELIQLQ